MTVGHAKKEILAEIKKKYDIDIPYERCRLRKKCYKTASKVFLNEQKFEDLHSQFEMIVQELPDKEPVTDPNQIVLFVRRWLPAKLQLAQFQEIVMDSRTVEELKKKVRRSFLFTHQREEKSRTVVSFLLAVVNIGYSRGIHRHSEGKG